MSRRRVFLQWLALVLAFAVLLLAALPAMAQEPETQPTLNVYFIELHPAPDGATDPTSSLRATYERLEPVLNRLVVEEQVAAFEYLAEVRSVRLIATEDGIRMLAARSEVAGVTPPVPPTSVLAPEAKAPARTQPPAPDAERPARPAVPGVTYTISGIVRDWDGTVLQDVRVATDYSDPTFDSDYTDASGHYSLTVNPGTYHVSAEKYGWPPALQQTVTVPPSQTMDFTLPVRYTISGKVLDWDGIPITEAYVSTDYNDPVSTGDQTDATGTYTLTVSAGIYHVGVYKSDLPSLPDQTVTVPPSQVVDFAYSQRFTISGKVLDWDHTPIADAYVSTDYRDPVSTSDQTDATGAYTLTVTAGTYHVSVYKSNLPSLLDQVVTVPPNRLVDFTYPRRYTVRGTVRNYDGAGVKSASVSTSWNDPLYSSATTDASGAYTLTVTAGAYTLSAYKSGYPDSEKRKVTVPPDATGVNFTFPQPFPMSGTVRDQNGTPVQGATIYGGLSSATTAADGTYTTMAGPGDHYVSAQKSGYQSAPSVLVPVPPAATGVDFVLLVKDQVIRGRVVNTQGQPLEDAYVSASSIVCGNWGSGGTATTADGAYTLTVPSGVYHVTASSDGYVPAPPELARALATNLQAPDAVEVNFTLTPLANSIRGTVRDSLGRPLENASVYASACGLTYGTDTDVSGAYTLTVSANTFSVSASKSGYTSPPAQSVSVPPDASRVDFALTARVTYTITGRVTDPQGNAVMDVWVGTESGPDYDSDNTDVDGKYALHVTAGSYQVGAEKDGWSQPALVAVSVPPNRSGVDFVISPLSLSIKGTVRDAAGHGVTDAWVCPTLSGETSSFFCKRPYYNGAYTKLLPAGTYRVYASASCYTSATIQNVVLPPSRTGVDLTIRLRDQLIAGRVTDSAGQPLCGASVNAKDGFTDSDSTSRNGRYALNLPAGTYKVSASKTGYGAAVEKTVTVPPFAIGTDFVLGTPPNTIQGMVRDRHGAAIAGASVFASSTSGTASAATGADGKYTLKVLDGKWNVSASKAGYVGFPGVRTATVPPSQTGIDFMLVVRSEVKSDYLPLIVKR